MEQSFHSVVIHLDGRIDTANVIDTERVIMQILSANADRQPVFDASNLSYISSAGLRLLLKISKMFKNRLEIRETNAQIYDILETTGFTQIFDVYKKPRNISIENCPIIGRGFYGTVYRLNDDTIVKVYQTTDALKMIKNERAKAKTAFISGLPTAISFDIVKVGDTYGSVFELVGHKSFNDLMIEKPNDADEIIRQYAEFLRNIHKTTLISDSIDSAKQQFLGYLDIVQSDLPQNDYERFKKLLSDLPDCTNAVHGDCQMKNIMVCSGEPMLIDMDTLAVGHPIFDLQGIEVTYRIFGEDDPENAKDFLGLDADTARLIAQKTVAYYFHSSDETTLANIRGKIRLVAMLRFLWLIRTTDLQNNAFAEKRINRAKSEINRLLAIVDSLDFTV